MNRVKIQLTRSKGPQISRKRRSLGERRIIEIIREHLDLVRMPIPFGDDVSGYAIGKEKVAVLKTDMLVGKTDVPDGMTLWQAARKAIVMNVSDFAAKGVKPLVVLVSLGLPRYLNQKSIEEVADGLNSGAREYGAHIIGGDTGESSDLVISVSLFGTAQRRKLMLRNGAKPGDFVAVTGSFGRAPAGLRILLGQAKAKKEENPLLVEAVLMPSARLEEGLALARSGAVSASIDSSDGLAWSLHEIAFASHVGFVIDELPVSEETVRFCRTMGFDVFELTLYGGEEYELVVTVTPNLWSKAEEAVRNVGGRLFRIGKVTLEGKILFQSTNRARVIQPRGYEHFMSNNA